MKKHVFFCVFTLLCLYISIGKAQSPTNTALKNIIQAVADRNEQLPTEKLYLHLDKPYYTIGDTLRFSAYLLNGDYLTPSTRSGIIYVEIDDEANRMTKRVMFPVTAGFSWGNIVLDGVDIPEGSCILRAYTSWMLNFGEDYVFKRNIYISPIMGISTLVNAGFKLQSLPDKDNVEAAIKLSGLNGEPLRLKDMQLRVKAANKTLFKDRYTTGMDGVMRINFDLADKTAINNLSIQANQTGKGADTTILTIPVIIDRPENTDLQFMPEGGNMVAGIAAKIGYKAISEDGKGKQLEGKVMNSRQQQVAEFKTTHNGMGSFEFTPQAGESYTANIGNNKTYPLPAVQPSGTSLKITAKDSVLEVSLNITKKLLDTPKIYYLVGQSRGVVCYAASVIFKDVELKKTISKKLFPTGIVRFTLLSADKLPLNERIVFVNHHDELNITVYTQKTGYTTRDSIALTIQVKDNNGKPVNGKFSVAVTDDDQVRTDSLGKTMVNELLFTTDLKGNIEEPGWYLQNNAPERIAALDNLLLTQGWVSYSWKDVLNPLTQPPKYTAQQEFNIQGQLSNALNKPLKKTRVTLMQKEPLLILDTISNDEGRFVLKGKNMLPSDSSLYMIQVINKDGERRDFNTGISLDELAFPVFAQPKQRLSPWYVNSDTLLLNNTGTKMAQLKAEDNYKGPGTLLKEVNIHAKKIIKGSYNMNGPGEADIIMDEAEMKKATGLYLADLLKKKFGDRFLIKERYGRRNYTLDAETIRFVIDGIILEKIRVPVEVYMETLKASDIRGIEIMAKSGFAFTYEQLVAYRVGRRPALFAPTYLEITTYSGHGAYLKPSAGRYMLKPIAFGLQKNFYSPRYTVKNIAEGIGTDLRSTIHWEPNIITDSTGKATVSFFSADKPAGYTIIIEGTDLNGDIGYKRQKIKVVSKTVAAK